MRSSRPTVQWVPASRWVIHWCVQISTLFLGFFRSSPVLHFRLIGIEVGKIPWDQTRWFLCSAAAPAPVHVARMFPSCEYHNRGCQWNRFTGASISSGETWGLIPRISPPREYRLTTTSTTCPINILVCKKIMNKYRRVRLQPAGVEPTLQKY